MKMEINPRLTYKRYTIQFLSVIKGCWNRKEFIDMTRNNILATWINIERQKTKIQHISGLVVTITITKLAALCRFFKWLHYPDVKREVSYQLLRENLLHNGHQTAKEKEVSCYKPSDLWSQEDDLVFLKWVTNKRDRCYHTMSRDLSART
ncbi:MAG TPA: hypothetical protein VE593_02710 [Nitrososphaeraceae archaeon]|nr:hypothetical protein [Nitrososphaeraceae archaeon]